MADKKKAKSSVSGNQKPAVQKKSPAVSDKLDVAGAKPVKKPAKTKSAGKKQNIFVRAAKRVARWFREVKSEAKKVTWPTFKQVVNNTLVVIAVVIIVGTLIVVADLVFRNGLTLFIGLF